MRMLTSASLSQGRGLWRNGVEPLDDASPRSDFRDRYEYGDLQGLYPVGLANWCAWARWVRTEGGNVRGRRRAIVGGREFADRDRPAAEQIEHPFRAAHDHPANLPASARVFTRRFCTR